MKGTVEVQHCDFLGAKGSGASCYNKIGTLASSGAKWKEGIVGSNPDVYDGFVHNISIKILGHLEHDLALK